MLFLFAFNSSLCLFCNTLFYFFHFSLPFYTFFRNLIIVIENNLGNFSTVALQGNLPGRLHVVCQCVSVGIEKRVAFGWIVFVLSRVP